MSQYNPWNTTPSSVSPSSPSHGKHSKGKWYVPLTLLGIALVCVFSMLMCWLTRDVRDRPIWMMGLIFMIPAGAMFFATMFLEYRTGTMTPATSRKPQMIVAIVATLLTFTVGCLCDAIYLYGGFIQDAGVKYVFAMDRGDTTSWTVENDGQNDLTRGEMLTESATRILAKMPSYTDVGMVTFSWEALQTVELYKADASFKQLFSQAQTLQGDEGVSYVNAINTALTIAEKDEKHLPTRIMLFTGGNEAVWLKKDPTEEVYTSILDESSEAHLLLSSPETRASIIERCKQSQCKIYVISPTGVIDAPLMEVVNETGGISVSVNEALVAREFISLVTVDGDMLRSGSYSSKILSLIMFLLEGLGIGICLSIMLSVQGQKRFQVVLTPLMGLLGFVMVKLVGSPENNPVGSWWFWESLSFLPLGLILMRANTSRTLNAPTSGTNSGAAGVSHFDNKSFDQFTFSNSQYTQNMSNAAKTPSAQFGSFGVLPSPSAEKKRGTKRKSKNNKKNGNSDNGFGGSNFGGTW